MSERTATCVGGPHDGETVKVRGTACLFPLAVVPKRVPILYGPNADTFTVDKWGHFEWTDPDCRMTFPTERYEYRLNDDGTLRAEYAGRSDG